ncbi:MAG: phosphate acyltransferase PlsX [Desulfatiglandales bacterium]
MKIAVDAMGGDHAPDVVVQGVLQAAIDPSFQIILIGDERVIGDRFGNDLKKAGVSIHHCEDKVLMDEPPLKAVRRKKDASVRVAFDLVKRGEADAVVSAGHSGAMLAAAILTLGRAPGVERPAFASIYPGEKGEVVLIDVGANVDCRPVHLLQFGVMAHAFAATCRGMENPRIGLLSIGQEGGKGNEQVRQAHQLFQSSGLNFVGNVEGRDIFSGQIQVVVCDGFVGNVVLKVLEGMAESFADMLESAVKELSPGKTGESVDPLIITRLKGKLDYAEYGGAPILGIKGVGIVCHGGSSAKAVKNGIRMAASHVRNGIPDRLAEAMGRFQGGHE